MNSEKNISTFLKKSSSLGELHTKLNNIEASISQIGSRCKLFREVMDKTWNTDVANVELYQRNINCLTKLMALIEMNIEAMAVKVATTKPLVQQQQGTTFQIIDLSDADHDNDDKDDSVEVVVQKFVNFKRECPICYDSFTTTELIFAPCSHHYCPECFLKLRDDKCPMCMVQMDVGIKYKKSGDNLTYSLMPLTTYTTLPEEQFIPSTIISSRYTNDELYIEDGGMDTVDSFLPMIRHQLLPTVSSLQGEVSEPENDYRNQQQHRVIRNRRHDSRNRQPNILLINNQ